MTVEEIRDLLRAADADEFAALERSLAADQRKGVRKAVEIARKRIEAEREEAHRIEMLYAFDRSFEPNGGIVVGLDEVGRGPVAGPLAVGAVVLGDGDPISGLNDSKQVKPEMRCVVAAEVKERALAWTVEYISPEDIDAMGISISLKRAFTSALANIEAQGVVPDAVLIDGNPLHIDNREYNVVKGDAKSASIAAASIVAKVERDAYMSSIAGEYPEYHFDENKGYGSEQHIEAIRKYGLTPIHRKSFCRSFMQETLF